MNALDLAVCLSEDMQGIQAKEELEEYFDTEVAFNEEVIGYEDWLWCEYQGNLLRLQHEKPSILKEGYAPARK